jgi:hypothetical protein
MRMSSCGGAPARAAYAERFATMVPCLDGRPAASAASAAARTSSQRFAARAATAIKRTTSSKT